MVYFMKSMFHLRLWFFCWIIYTNNSDSVFFGNPPKRSEHQFPLKSLKYSIYTLWSSNMAGWDIPTNYSGYKMLYLYIYIPYILSIDYPILFYHHVDLNVNHFKDLSSPEESPAVSQARHRATRRISQRKRSSSGELRWRDQSRNRVNVLLVHLGKSWYPLVI